MAACVRRVGWRSWDWKWASCVDDDDDEEGEGRTTVEKVIFLEVVVESFPFDARNSRGYVGDAEEDGAEERVVMTVSPCAS